MRDASKGTGETMVHAASQVELSQKMSAYAAWDVGLLDRLWSALDEQGELTEQALALTRHYVEHPDDDPSPSQFEESLLFESVGEPCDPGHCSKCGPGAGRGHDAHDHCSACDRPGHGAIACKWKTRLCQTFRHGHCARGASCSYAHGETELRGVVGPASPLPPRTAGLGSATRAVPASLRAMPMVAPGYAVAGTHAGPNFVLVCVPQPRFVPVIFMAPGSATHHGLSVPSGPSMQ